MNKEKINQEIGARIKRIRKENKMTLLELANKVGLSEGTVQRYESGNIANVAISVLETFAKALNVPPAFLLGWSQSEFQNRPQESLTPDEQEAMGLYRQLDTGDQGKSKGYMSGLLESEKYKSKESRSAG